jgi:hypothetical protein
MWALISRSKQLLIVVALTVLTILGLQGAQQWWSGTTPPLYKAISTIAFVVGTVAASIANWSWRWLWRQLPILNKAFFPDLNGTWVGTLETTWKDANGVRPGPIASEITIHQSLFAISVTQRTGESVSHSTRVIAEAEPDADRYRLWYSYSNRPRATLQDRSAPHEGVAWLEVSLSDQPNQLVGQYYTGRGTRGDISVRRGEL